MRKISLVAFVALCLIAGGSVAQSLYSNSNFDDGDAIVVDASTTGVANGTAIPDWRLVAVGGATGNFAVVAEETAPSAPNVLEFAKTAAGQFQIDRWATPVPIVPGVTYKHSYWIRKIAGNPGPVTLQPFAMTGQTEAPWFENRTWNYTATAYTIFWEKHEAFCTFPEGAGYSCPYLIPEEIGTTFQVDNFMLEDATLMDQFPNGRFENSEWVLGWNTKVTFAGMRNLRCNIVTIPSLAAEGSHCLSFVQDPVETTGDSLIRSHAIPWVEGHTAYLAFSVKDDPFFGVGSKLYVVLHSHNGTAEANPLGYMAVGADDGGYKRYEFEVPVPQEGANKLYLDFRLRNSEGAGGTEEGVYVDFVSLGDLTAGGVPVEMSTFEME